jgi:hypothetical protein
VSVRPSGVEYCIESNQKTHFNSYVHVREAVTFHVLLPVHVFVHASYYIILLVGTFYSLPNFAMAILFTIAMYILREGVPSRIVRCISLNFIWIYLGFVYMLFHFRIGLVIFPNQGSVLIRFQRVSTERK